MLEDLMMGMLYFFLTKHARRYLSRVLPSHAQKHTYRRKMQEDRVVKDHAVKFHVPKYHVTKRRKRGRNRYRQILPTKSELQIGARAGSGKI
jgi:hypothetical protein